MTEQAAPPGAVGRHPAPETLRAYRADELTPAEDASVREHLARCADCAGLVLDLAGVAEPAAEAELSEIDVERAWREARPRLLGTARAPRPKVRSRSRSFWTPMLAAAVLAAVAAPFAYLWVSSDGAGERAARLRVAPLNPTRGAEPAGPCTALPAGAATWRLFLPVRGERRSSAYALQVLTEERRRLSSRAVEHRTAGGLAVDLPAADLPPGRYRLQVVARENGEATLLEQFCVDVPDG